MGDTAVFKKFEKENLLQIMCAGELELVCHIPAYGLSYVPSDIVERFQLSLMLSIIALRNMIEMAGSDIAFLPKSFIRGKSLLDAILSVCHVAHASPNIYTEYSVVVAGNIRDNLGDGGGLAETCVHHQIQSR
jgi:hypothetical protein